MKIELRLTRLYIHNYKCFQNFGFDFGNIRTCAIIGQNGAGKTALANALDVFRQIGLGEGRVDRLVKIEHCWKVSEAEIVRFEIAFTAGGKNYTYGFALEWPEGFKALRIAEETLTANGETILSRDRAQVNLVQRNGSVSQFTHDWHEFALPHVFLADGITHEAVKTAREFLAGILVIHPIPDDMGGGEASGENEALRPRCDNFEAWLCRRLTETPELYIGMKEMFAQFRPLRDFFNFTSAGGRLTVRFKAENEEVRELPFSVLSSGEKIYFLAAAIKALNATGDRPVICLWDEIENYLSLSEMGRVMEELKRVFRKRGQLLVATHSDEILARFADADAYHLMRNSHLEPTRPGATGLRRSRTTTRASANVSPASVLSGMRPSGARRRFSTRTGRNGNGCGKQFA